MEGSLGKLLDHSRPPILSAHRICKICLFLLLFFSFLRFRSAFRVFTPGQGEGRRNGVVLRTSLLSLRTSSPSLFPEQNFPAFPNCQTNKSKMPTFSDFIWQSLTCLSKTQTRYSDFTFFVKLSTLFLTHITLISYPSQSKSAPPPPPIFPSVTDT